MANGKNYALRIEDLAVVDNIEKLLIKICAVRNVLYSEAIKVIFMAGFEHLISQPETEITDKDDKLNWKILTTLQKIQFEENKNQYLYKLLEKLGKEDFVKWCEENGVAYEPILGSYAEFAAQDAANETKNIGIWLEDQLGDMLPHKYSAILVSAQIEGILPDAVLYPDEYKSKLKTLANIAASRGYSNREHRGIWQKMLR